MSLSYKELVKSPRVFYNLTGLTIAEFQQIIHLNLPNFCLKEASKKAVGRPSNLSTLENKLLCLLIYYRCYITQVFLGYLFNLHKSNICRQIAQLEPLLVKTIHIKKARTLTYEKILELVADVTESPTERPKRQCKQKAKYSGKKKRHTNKTEIVIDKNTKRIISVSKSYGGRTHDFKIRKQEKPISRDAFKIVDSGYQGLQKKKIPLTLEEKLHNKELSSKRIIVEHVIRQIKIYRIIKDTYRSFQRKYNLRFNIVAGIVNLKQGFI